MKSRNQEIATSVEIVKQMAEPMSHLRGAAFERRRRENNRTKWARWEKRCSDWKAAQKTSRGDATLDEHLTSLITEPLPPYGDEWSERREAFSNE